MSQQINFYNSKLVKPKDWFSLSVVVIVYVISVALMFIYYQQLQSEVAQSEQARHVAQTQFEAVQLQLTEVMGSSQNKAKLQELELQLKDLHDKVLSQEKVIKAFAKVQGSSHIHLADYMEAFARQRVENVWLTGFKIDAFTDSLTLMGRTVKGELVPQFINNLSQSPVFRGQLFGGLKLKELTQTNGTAAPSSQSTAQQVAPQAIEKDTQKSFTLIEFEVNGVDIKPNESVPSSTTTLSPNTLDPNLSSTNTSGSMADKKKELSNG